jgi:DNA-binding SARP family transcriptional activator
VSTLRIRLFGSLDLERDGHPLAAFPSRKSRDLFAYLAVHRQSPHAREQLAGVFWGESAEDRARHALNTTLWRIHRVLGDDRQGMYLRVSAQHIGFNLAGDVWLDVAEFESRCVLAEHTDSPAQQAALLRQAVSFYRADLLMDCYEDWCLIERERLQGLYLRALARLLTYHWEQRDYDQAIECARRILGCDPLREEVHRDLMRLLLESGLPAAALRQYRTCEELLRQELAINPAPETRGLLATILASSDVPTPVAEPPSVRIDRLSAMCDTLRTQLAETTALLDRVTDELNTLRHPGPTTPRLRKVVG